MMPYLKEHQNYQKSKKNVLKKSVLISKVVTINLYLVVALMSLEIVPHLKGLNSGLKPSIRRERGFTFTL